MSINIFSTLTIIRTFLFATLAVITYPTMADNGEQLTKQVKKELASFIALYDEKINYDAQFPYDIAKHNNDIESGFSQNNPDNTDPNNVLEFKLSATKQMNEFLQTMPAEEIKEFRQTLADAAKQEQEDKEFQLQKKREVAEYREQQRIAKSLPTYDRDHFYQAEQEFFQHYNKLINFDDQIPVSYFGYHQEGIYQQIKDRLADASTAKQKRAAYLRAEQDVIMFASRLYAMSAEDIAQFRANMLTASKRKNLMAEHNRLKAKLEQLAETLADYKNEGEELISDTPSCSHTNVDFDCHSQCEIRVRDIITGLYKTDYDYRCVRRCSDDEESKQYQFDSEESDCVSERRDAQKALDHINRDYEPTLNEYNRKREQLSEIERQLKG